MRKISILLHSDSWRESLYSMNAFIFSIFMKISPSLETLGIYTISVMAIGVWQKRWDHAWHYGAIFQWKKSQIYIKVRYVSCLPAATTYRNFQNGVGTPVDVRLLGFVSSLGERILHRSYLKIGKLFRLKRKGLKKKSLPQKEIQISLYTSKKLKCGADLFWHFLAF